MMANILGILECAKANFATFRSDDSNWRLAMEQLDDAIFRVRAAVEAERLTALRDATCGHVRITTDGDAQ